jgi:serine/threonine protein kinase
MQGKLHHYNITTTLAKKYSHSTYLASSIDEPEQQVILILYSSSLFSSVKEQKTFLQKAQLLKELQHPHILSLLHFAIEEKQPFVVREHLPNGSLRSHLKQLSSRQPELYDALHIVLQVGEALAYAHQHHIFHGNLKPENILFDANGQAVLTDFHLVSRKDAIIRDQTSEEYAFCYMAPEQFAGTTDAGSDQYALGCLTYELITGQVPFTTQSLASMMGQPNYVSPTPPSEHVADLPPSLEAAILKALAKDPTERFFDFSLFLEVIRSILSPTPAFPFLHSTADDSGNINAHPSHPLKAQSILSSSRQSVACLSFPPETSEASASTNTKHDLAEFVDALRTPETHILKQLKNSPSSDDPFDDPSLINPATEPDDTESDMDLIDEEHGLEVDGKIVPLPNSTDKDILPKKQTPHNRRKIFKLVPLGIVILAIVMTAWSNNTAFLPVKKSAPDMFVQQKPTQAFIPQGNASPTIQLTVPNPSVTLTIQPTTPNPSATPAIQPTIPNPSATSTSSHPTPSSSNPTPKPKPTPKPTPTPTLQTTTIDDNVTGTGTNQFNYVGSYWSHDGPGCPGPNCSNTYPSYNDTSSWDSQVNEYVTLSFTGVRIKLYGVIDPMYGIGAVSIDGGSETNVDFYASTHEGNQLLWTSPTLPAGKHTFKLRVTGNHNSNARPDVGFPPVLDRVDILG